MSSCPSPQPTVEIAGVNHVTNNWHWPQLTGNQPDKLHLPAGHSYLPRSAQITSHRHRARLTAYTYRYDLIKPTMMYNIVCPIRGRNSPLRVRCRCRRRPKRATRPLKRRTGPRIPKLRTRGYGPARGTPNSRRTPGRPRWSRRRPTPFFHTWWRPADRPPWGWPTGTTAVTL